MTVASGKSEVLLPETYYAEDWSPDGRSLLIVDSPATRLSLLAIAGEVKPKTILETSFANIDFRFSADRQFVAYASAESGTGEVYVASFPGFGEKRRISKTGGVQLMWRKDGRKVLFLAPSGDLMSAAIRTGSKIEADIPKALFKPSVRLSGSTFRSAFRSIAASGDGRRFLVVETQSNGTPEFMVVVNWAAELQQQN